MTFAFFHKASLPGFLQTDIFYWIGLTDLAEEGSWVWQTEYKEAKFTFWRKGEPSGGENEHCVHLVGYQYLNDIILTFSPYSQLSLAIYEMICFF